ncbi:Na+/H+ antiporter subunit E [Leucobacter luti]|uniref:Multisubunit sodium/proton antiporter MrpE subunit n=1 Tax=Leucobacter luti TaxID=340320 RepID=A0A4Q7TKU2_9MICO|nr:Na+/H+ antiporter subunit E [Leucobacter luti]MBL3700079.1 Na+/H+ antiporter subunit E [Leucobacter luti]RZT61201.1 multisubunit sodium/proton antiporter MrpE subunit [Leucobacter luti]
MTESATPRAARRLELGVRLHELPLLVGLVLLWMMLWHEVSLLSLVSGVVLAIVVMRVFYLPPVELAGRFNPWYALRYLVYFLWNLALASWQVAWLAVRPGPPPPTSIIAVRLRTRNDFILTMVGLTISLIPGSLVAEVDRFESTLYLHVLNTPTQRSITRMRRDVRHIERLLILTLGSKQEIGALN